MPYKTKSAKAIFKNFETACKEIAQNNIPLKQTPWKSEKICQKHEEENKAANLRFTAIT